MLFSNLLAVGITSDIFRLRAFFYNPSYFRDSRYKPYVLIKPGEMRHYLVTVQNSAIVEAVRE